LVDERGLTRIDFLSLDVEGYEDHVLKGVDFSRHPPTYICVEARHRSAVEQVLLTNYTVVEQLTDMDVLYRVRT
jgi:Methyltransferase FkbM domain